MVGRTDGIGALARFNSPQGVAYDGAGHLYIADSLNQLIRRLDLATLAVTTWAGTAGVRRVSPGPLPGGFNTPIGVVVVGPNDILVTDRTENAILRVH
jgi:DNA-binding beta-propeller fold protein YncE